ncbi:hypothetical protein UlMin_001071 [Ulmus minor]
MASELGLLSLTHLHKLAQSQKNKNQDQVNPNSSASTSTTTTQNLSSSTTTSAWMWNPKQSQEEDDSWEVRAFAEDTGNVMGTTWPPRSYTCAFCRREFRSAQALGGHMNVHRRDRARLHQVHQPNSLINPTISSNPTSSFLIPTQEFVANGGGLCLLYQLPNPNNPIPSFSTTPPSLNSCNSSDHHHPSPSTLLSMSPHHPPTNFVPLNFPARPPPLPPGIYNNAPRSHHHSNGAYEEAEPSEFSNNGNEEELDLELRLGHRPTTPN